MNAHDEERMKQLLRQAMPPVDQTEPARDLWPAVLRRLGAQPAAPPWFDWALLRWPGGFCSLRSSVHSRASLLPVNPRALPQNVRFR